MDPNHLIAQAQRIISDCKSDGKVVGALAEAQELTRVYVGEKSAFYKSLSELKQGSRPSYNADFIVSALEGFIQHVENGLFGGVSIHRLEIIDVF